MTGDETYSIVLSTASPFKFNDVVLASIDPDTYEGKALDPFVAMDDLSRLAKMPIRPGCRNCPSSRNARAMWWTRPGWKRK